MDLMTTRRRTIAGMIVVGLIGCGGEDGDSGGPTGTGVGNLEVMAATTGVELDADGYTVTLGTDQSQALSINGSVTFTNVPAGTYDLTLSGVSVNCTPIASGERRITVPAGSTRSIRYDVECTRKVILFVSTREGRDNIYRMNDDGFGQAPVTTSPGNNREPAWSPDGASIVFVSDRDGGEEIYTMNADGSNVVRLTNQSGSDTSPAWSPDGTRIAFSSNRGGNFDIYVMDADGTDATPLTNHAAADLTPSWSPDGTVITFVSTRDGNEELYRMDANGANLQRLTNDPAIDGAPSWSPDGTRIAFHTRRSGHFEIFLMDPDGDNVVRRTLEGEVESQPQWSPNGFALVFVTAVQNNDEVCTGGTSGGAINISDNAARDYRPAWRP